MKSKTVRPRLHLAAIASALVVALPAIAQDDSLPIGTGRILIEGLSIDVDTRPDLEGNQYRLTAVKDFPWAIGTVVSVTAAEQVGYRVSARLTGPGLGSGALTLLAPAGGRFELPPFGQAGDYSVEDVHLEGPLGNRVVNRSPALPRIEIRVIDEVIVSEVTTRRLSLEEIRDRGIVLDARNFAVFNFSLALTLESRSVVFNVPVVQPLVAGVGVPTIPSFVSPVANVGRGIQAPDLDIPNFQMMGFFVEAAPGPGEEPPRDLPGLPGLILIPGDVGFLNQFFSAILVVTNVAPQGSGLTVSELRGRIRLPAGADGAPGSGDDPLRLAVTRDGGSQEVRPIQRTISGPGGDTTTGEDFLLPQERGQSEFLLEGLREGTHSFDVDITGRLFVPSRNRSYDLRGRAAGAVVVRNPSFNLILAHPETVREGERYSMFVTVSNTSDVDANLFRVRLLERRRERRRALLASLEKNLASLHIEYAAKRKSLRLRPPELHVMKSGW